VVGCAQGVNGLDEVWDAPAAALLANFNSIFYFSSREDQTDEHAMLNVGIHENPKDTGASNDVGTLQILEGPQSGQARWVCPPGSLARLPQHHVYARLANGTVTKTPVWLRLNFTSPFHRQSAWRRMTSPQRCRCSGQRTKTWQCCRRMSRCS